MKEKELRLALVCYGGVSLVLYMHGVIKEILKLARASKAYHSMPNPERRQAETFASLNGSDGRERDTEEAYFSLLKVIGRKLDLRVIVDSVAGASAGGISGIILARALAHDLSIDHLRNMWFEGADVLRLLAPKQRARPSAGCVARVALIIDPVARAPASATEIYRHRLAAAHLPSTTPAVM